MTYPRYVKTYHKTSSTKYLQHPNQASQLAYAVALVFPTQVAGQETSTSKEDERNRRKPNECRVDVRLLHLFEPITTCNDKVRQQNAPPLAI